MSDKRLFTWNGATDTDSTFITLTVIEESGKCVLHVANERIITEEYTEVLIDIESARQLRHLARRFNEAAFKISRMELKHDQKI